jgi:hypothetical protein
MSQPKKPFYVSFTHDPIPQQIDHSRSRPGPGGEGANRVGFTSVTSKARMTVVWDDAPAGADGRIPIFAKSINIYFRLTDFLVAVSSDFSVRSCAYRVTQLHELQAHIYDPIRIFHSYRDVLIGRLNAIAVPTREAPARVAPNQVAPKRAEMERQVVSAIGQTRRELARDLQQARERHDSAASYRLVYNQCTDAEWSSGR